MSSGFQSTQHINFGLSSNNGAHVLKLESPPSYSGQPAAGTTETHDTAPRLRLASMGLDELSEELDKRTKETQRLQEVVENATKEALERFGCTYVLNNSPGQSCHNHRFNVSHQQSVTEPLVCRQDSVNQTLDQSAVSSPEKNLLHNEMDVYLQQMSDAQLNKTRDQLKQTFNFDNAIVNLQTKMHIVQTEKDAQSDLRLKESTTHVDQMEKMLSILEDLQNMKRAADQKLQEPEAEALALNRKVEKLEQVIMEIYSSLVVYEKHCGSDENLSLNITTGLSQTAKVSDDLKNETDNLQEKAALSVEHLGSDVYSGLNKEKERMEDLIASLGQEMAVLTDMLSSSKQSSISLSVKLEMLKKLSESQCQVSELESTFSSHKDKIYCLEQQLAQAQLVDAQTKQEQCLQQAHVLQSHLLQLKRCGEQQQSEIQVVVSSLRGQLVVAREHLRRSREEKMCLHALLERRIQEDRETQVLLQEKDKELQLSQQENQHLSRLEEAQSRCQTLRAEGDMLRQKLEDKEKMINILRLQTESSSHSVEHHSHTNENLHQENSLLSNQLNQHKLEIQNLRAELDQHKSDLADVEQEKHQLQASVAEQSQRVQEESVKKQQLITYLKDQRMQLLTLTKEHKELQRLHSCKTEEQEGVVLDLQRQLRNTHGELDQVRITLRNLEEADGHGLQVAMDMQKEITARREQVDTLQGKILRLKDALDKMYQKKHYQNLKYQRQLQELTFIREENRQLANELESLRSKDQQLRDRIGDLQAILHKMSESFTDCQDFIQLQEQEFFQLKLQHALNLKELQGKHMNSALNEPPTAHDSMTPSTVTAPPSSQHFSNPQTKSKRQQENPTQKHRSVVEELRGVISENSRPHTDNIIIDRSFHMWSSTDKIKEVKVGSRLRRNIYDSKPHLLMTAELNGRKKKTSFIETSAAKYAYLPQVVLLGQRSPVHSLLTSDPNS